MSGIKALLFSNGLIAPNPFSGKNNISKNSLEADVITCNNVRSQGEILNLISDQQISITSSEDILINANNTTGGIKIMSGLGGVDFTSIGDINFTADDNTLITTGGIDLTSGIDGFIINVDQIILESTFNNIQSIILTVNSLLDINTGNEGMNVNTSGEINFNSTELEFISTLGGITMDANDAINFTTTSNLSNAIRLFTNTNIIDMNLGINGFEDTTTGQILISSSQEANTAVQFLSAGSSGFLMDIGSGGSSINSTDGQIQLISSQAANDAFQFTATGGAINLIGTTNQVSFTTTSVDANAIQFDATNASSGIYMHSLTGGYRVDSDGLISFTTTRGMGSDIVIEATGVTGGINNTCGTGGTEISGTGNIVLSSTSSDSDALIMNGGTAGNGGIKIRSGTDGFDLNSTGEINMRSLQIADDAIEFVASNGGGIFYESDLRHIFDTLSGGLHLKYSQQGTPGVSAGGNYTGESIDASSTDVCGIVSFTSILAGPIPGTITLTWTRAYSKPPTILYTFGSLLDSYSSRSILSNNTTDVTIQSSSVLPATPGWLHYVVVEI